MKVLIAVDMEGISGVVDRSHVNSTSSEYARFRHIMTADVNAAVRRAVSAGATEVIISDGHGGAKNILVEELDAAAHLHTGNRTKLQMIRGLDKSVDGVLFIGYHAMNGAENAILSHTMSSAKIGELRINGRPTGEFGLNAAVAGFYGVPAIMISGDQTACAEAKSFVSGLQTAVVKTAHSRSSAECLPISESRALIEATAAKAVRKLAEGKAPAPLLVKAPVSVEVEFYHEAQADSAELLPGAKRLDARTVGFKVKDSLQAALVFEAACSLG